MSTAITSGVNYSLKPTSVKCNRKTVVCPSSNKLEFSAGDTAVLYLPSLRNHVMDGQSGYFRFKLTIDTADGFLDVSAHSLIERICCFGSGGQLVSDINNYRSIATMMLDCQLSQSEKIGLSSILGTEELYFTPTDAAAAFATANTPTADEVSALVPNANRKGKTLTDGDTYSFCLPILHPLFAMSEKYWPCFAMNDQTRMEITFSSQVNSVVGTTTWTLKNPEIVVDFIEFDSAVMPLIEQTYSGRDLVIPSQDYSYYASQLTSGASGTITHIIPAKQQSARAFFFGFRPAETQAQVGYSTGSRTCPFYSTNDSFSLVIGGQKLPNKPITTDEAGNFSNYFASTQTALHAFNNLEMNGSLTASYYNVSGSRTGHTVGATSYQNAFMLGINLDSLRGQNQTTNSGLNLSSVTTYYEGYIGTSCKTSTQVNNLDVDEAVTVDAFLLHDVLFIVDTGGNVSLRM